MEERLPLFSPKPGSGPRVIDYRAELNPAQFEAVTTLEGPILCVAGAGSGKTRTLVYRVAYLVDQGVRPESILLLTFTRKAASEMLERARNLVGDRCARVSGGTFHSLAHELLRRWAERVGYPAGFGVMDRGDMEEVLSHLRRQAGLGEKDKRFPKRSTLATMISKAANKGLALEDLLLRDYVHLKAYRGDIEKLAQDYAAYKLESGLFDFDDLLIHLARLLEQDLEAREAIASDYQYIMVDEYQDTNPLQAEIVRYLGQGHRNVMVVGDEAQSIYSFRGATFRNIMDFPVIFPGSRVVRLEENYRSRQPILDLTNHIISRAREGYDKRLFTRREGGERPNLIAVPASRDQSEFICRKVEELTARGVAPSRMAVLFRAARDSFDLEVELMRREIAFVKYGGRRFLESAHVKDLLALLRAAANPKDGLSLTRALLLLEGVGPKTASRIAGWIDGRRENLTALNEYPDRGKTQTALAPLAGLFREIGGKGVGLEERVTKSWEFYRPFMEARFDDHPARLADIQEFIRISEGYTSMTRFLADMALEPPNASLSRSGFGKEKDRLVLSTVHSAKGLEWRVVFIIWAVEGHLPPPYALKKQEDLDEERRLMYVAATRAEDSLYLVCPLETRGGPLETAPAVSRFLADVPPHLVRAGGKSEEEKTAASEPFPRQAGAVPAAPPLGGFMPGQRVNHPSFGLGRVLNLLSGQKIKVDFDHFGTKVLHLDYAGLEKA